AAVRSNTGREAGVSALDGHQVDRRVLASSIDLEIELVAFALVDAGQAGTLHRADVHEGIGLSIVADEEAEAFHRVEELDRAGRFLAGQLTLGSTPAVAPVAAIPTVAAARLHRHGVAHGLQIPRGNLPATIDQVEFELLPLAQTFEAGALDGADMDEHVLTAAFLLDEAEAFLSVEELDRALAGADDLCRHAAETAATATTAAARSATVAA